MPQLPFTGADADESSMAYVVPAYRGMPMLETDGLYSWIMENVLPGVVGNPMTVVEWRTAPSSPARIFTVSAPPAGQNTGTETYPSQRLSLGAKVCASVWP